MSDSRCIRIIVVPNDNIHHTKHFKFARVRYSLRVFLLSVFAYNE